MPQPVGQMTATSKAKVEDALFMLETGEHFDRAAERLGMTSKSLERLLNRAGYSVDRVRGRVA